MKSILFALSMILVPALVIIPMAWSDDDDDHGRNATGVAAVSNPVYKAECGDCHMAYPPGLLPARSWQKLMSGLEDHFGDNAELDAKAQKAITDYLVSNSADKSDYRRSQRFAAGRGTPTRISETAYFQHEHNEIPTRLVKGNKEVISFSNCNACHRKAEQGSFKERDIVIPGFGPWDD